MDGYNGGYGYLGSGFTTNTGDGQHESSSLDQHQMNPPFTHQPQLLGEQEMLQSYPHLRQSIGHEYQNSVSPVPTPASSIPRFQLPFPQIGHFPGFQNPELLQQYLEMQQLSPGNRQQSATGYNNVISSYLQPPYPVISQSIASALSNLQHTQAPKSPIDLHCSPSPSPARSSPNFFNYSQSVPSVVSTPMTETHTVSAIQNQSSLAVTDTNPVNSASYQLHDTYYKVKLEPLHVPDFHSTFMGQSSHTDKTSGAKLSDVLSDGLQQSKADSKFNLNSFAEVVPENILQTEQAENTVADNGTRVEAEVVKDVIETLTSSVKDISEDRLEKEVKKEKEMQENIRSYVAVPENTSDIRTENHSMKVKFVCRGNLSKSSKGVTKKVTDMLYEVVDCEERVFADIIVNFPVKQEDVKLMQESKSKTDTAVGEDANKSNQTTEQLLKLQEDNAKTENDSDNEIDDTNDNEIDETPTKEIGYEYDADESLVENNLSFSDLGIQDNWYSAAMKKYAELNDDLKPDFTTAKKGGRSDPENPFAITSPSFSESAARALVVTTNADSATLVMVSIMSIGSRQKLIPKLVNSDAAEGGIVSIVNPIETADSESKESDNESSVKTETTSIMSKLNREKKDIKDENEDNSIDRLDISIKIDDDQYISHGEQKRWQCKLCPKSYTTKHNLVAHILDHCSIKPHLCLVCGKYFKQLSHLNTHMLTHDNVKPHVCDICQKGFTQISHLKRHQAVHCDSKPYICDICNRGFAYPSELRIHKDKHIPGKDKCVDCGMEFPNQKELREHMDTHDHGIRHDLTCQHCGRTFRFPSQLRDHMMTHAGARPYMCTECGMDFMKEHHLKAHQFTHTGLRPFACPHCNRSFNQKANMVRHMLIHNAQRAFRCEICGKTFTQPQTLKAHMVVHADKKPYSCKFCGKQFGRLHNLQGHLHIHNNTKPYVCSICGSSFTLKGNLNRHKKVKHGLSESMENMEEDAVTFLGNLSDRIRDLDSTYDDLEASRDDGMVSDSKSPKKGRKSIPRKRIHRQQEDDSTKTLENGSEVENLSDEEHESERMNELTYSEEERENEERIKLQEGSSKYFDNQENNNTPRRKRKRDVSYRIEDVEENYDTEKHIQDNIQHLEDETQHLGDNIQPVGDNIQHSEDETHHMRDETDEVNENLDYDEDTENEIDKYEAVESVIPEKRSRRKRKVKCLAEGFVGDNFGDDDLEGWSPQPTKVRKKKGAKLDSLIASKFKNV